MKSRKIIRVSPASETKIRQYSSKRGLEFGAAADQLIGTGYSRITALSKYSKAPKKKLAAKKTKAPRKSSKRVIVKKTIRARKRVAK